MLRLTIVTSCCIIATGSAVAGPTFTNVQDPIFPGELGHHDILDGIYGGSFTQVGNDFIGGGASGMVNAIRMVDSGLGGVMNLVTGGLGTADDQIWSDGVAAARALARYADLPQSFGYFDGDSGGSFNTMFNVTGSGFNVTGSAVMDFSGMTWRWGRDGGPTIHSSRADENPSGADHMVTYRIEGLENGLLATWLLFWEDLPLGVSDRDFNDLVVEIGVIPLPSAAGLAGLGLIALGFGRRRRFGR
ncbi:MAG: DUF4114 domain-containing protein [Phycisphaeraceae bacterium]|nr:MAG: DUF4114 domain-containing protein [Phycisphaeraceae bacterium]